VVRNASIKLVDPKVKLLLFVHGIFNTATALSNLFVGIYLWKVEMNYITVAEFYLMLFIFSTSMYIVSGWIIPKVGVASIFRLGTLLHCLFFTLLLILQEKAAFYPIELGIFQGIALGFYWLSFNVLAYDFTSRENRGFFYGFNGFIQSLAGVLGPLISGLILGYLAGLKGYIIIFSISLFLYIITGAISLRIKPLQAMKRFYLKEALSPQNWSWQWKQILTGSFMYGIREGIFMFIINLLFYISTASELKLGWFSSLNAILSMIVFYFVGRRISQEKQGRFLLIGVLGVIGATLLLLAEINVYTLLAFGIVNAIFTPYILVPYSSIGFDVMEQSPLSAKLRTEFIIVREIAVNIGRVIPVLLFIFFYDAEGLSVIKWFLLVPTLALLGVWRPLSRIGGPAGPNRKSLIGVNKS
jgi:MFS transporter, YQGE family, putative transporter